MKEYCYKVFTKTSQWSIYAFDPQDGLRKALWFCWRDNEVFVKMQFTEGGNTTTYRLCEIDCYQNIYML